jgi:hypothetical protein
VAKENLHQSRLAASVQRRAKCRLAKESPHHLVAPLPKVATPDRLVVDHAFQTPVAPHELVLCKQAQSSQDVLLVEVLVVQQVTKMMISVAPRLKVAKRYANFSSLVAAAHSRFGLLAILMKAMWLKTSSNSRARTACQ